MRLFLKSYAVVVSCMYAQEESVPGLFAFFTLALILVISVGNLGFLG
jgi:hypothetical protein